jgi:hypothetical protein
MWGQKLNDAWLCNVDHGQKQIVNAMTQSLNSVDKLLLSTELRKSSMLLDEPLMYKCVLEVH